MENQQFKQPNQPDQPVRSNQPDQSNVVPPVMRVPQGPSQFFAPQHRVFFVPSVTAISLPDELPRTPMPGQPAQQSTFVAPSVTFLSLPQHIEQTPRPQFFSGKVPTYVPSARQQLPMDTTLPQTPMPSAQAFTSDIYNISMPVPSKSFPTRPPVSIPGSYSTYEGRTEPGISETLMGCAILIVLAIFILAALYYIST
ncbi:MAG: hypothetical protein ACYDER_17895 [Ktedonobacteraceae bacterium]